MPEAIDTALALDGLSISFGGLKAVSDFTLHIKPMELCGLIGPNGAGKTTVFNLITGVYVTDTGTMRVGNKSINGQAPHRVTKAGIARTFQNVRVFKDLSVLDNVLISHHMRIGYRFWDMLVRNGRFQKTEAEIEEKAIELLSIFGLENRKDAFAKNLPYGDQRRLEIARALATNPKILLLDEPAAGLNTKEKEELMGIVSDIRNRFKLAILLIEHDMKLVMGICERILVLDHGERIAEGTPKEIQSNPKVIEAYLGVG